MIPEANAPKITVRFGRVLKRGEHVLARVKEDGRWHDLARLAPAKADRPEEGTFVLQYLVAPRYVGEDERNRKVENWIRLYLIEIAHPAPWAFQRSYTTTTANLYNGESGDAHWTLIPATPPLSSSECTPLPDPHFGSDEEMLAWCEREKLTPVKDAQGNWDWQQAWESHQARSSL